MNNIRASTWRSTAMTLSVILMASVSRAEVTVSETPKVLGLTIAVDQTTPVHVDETTLKKMNWFPVLITVENRSNKPFQIETYGAFRKMPQWRTYLQYRSLIPFEMFDVDFELIQITDKERRRINLVRPTLPNLKSHSSELKPELETLSPGDGYALHTTVNFCDWKPANSGGLVNGSYDLQAVWTGVIVQDGKRIDEEVSSNVLRIGIR